VNWVASGITSNVRINLIKPGGALVGSIVGNQAPDSSPYSWTVGAPAVAGEQYRVRVAASDGSGMGESAIFTVVDIPQVSALSIVSPHGGESWEIGSTQAITWTASNIQGNCQLTLLELGLLGDTFKGIIRDSFAPGQNGGSWNWKVGDYQGGSAPPGSAYKVRIHTLSGDVIFSAKSAHLFTIVPKQVVNQPLIKVEATGFVTSRPDLAICLSWEGKMPLIYQDRTINVRVKNIGLGNAAAGSFKIYVEGHGDQIVPVPALAPKGEFSWSKKYDWKTCGHKTVRVTADPDKLIAESNENNNMLQYNFRVSCGEAYYLQKLYYCSDQN